MAEGPGFEPGLTGPEPVVLPLDDPSIIVNLITKNQNMSQDKTDNSFWVLKTLDNQFCLNY